jgi:hypothetical protein
MKQTIIPVVYEWTSGRERAIKPHKKLFTTVSFEIA